MSSNSNASGGSTPFFSFGGLGNKAALFAGATSVLGIAALYKRINKKKSSTEALQDAPLPELFASDGKQLNLEQIRELVDGITAVESVTYHTNNWNLVILPRADAPWRCLGDATQALISDKVSSALKNAVGEVFVTDQAQGQTTEVLNRARAGENVSTLVSSSTSLLTLLPLLHHLSEEQIGCVVNVVSGRVKQRPSMGDADEFTFSLDYANVLAARQTGAILLGSQTPKESHHMAIVSQALAAVAKRPVVHYFDSAYQAQKFKLLAPSEIQAAINQVVQAEEKRQSAEQADSEEADLNETDTTDENDGKLYTATSGKFTSENYSSVPELTERVLSSLSGLFNTTYHVFQYSGSPTAKNVIVSQGSAAAIAVAALADSPKDREVGVLSVRLARPWSTKLFLEALPATVESITVVDHEDRSNGGAFNDDNDIMSFSTLFMDVVSSVQQWSSHHSTNVPNVTANSYFTPEASLSLSSIQSVVTGVKTQLDSKAASSTVSSATEKRPVKSSKPETPYIKVLRQAFEETLEISNAIGSTNVWGDKDAVVPATPSERSVSFDIKQKRSPSIDDADELEYGAVEYGLGVLLASTQQREAFANQVADTLASADRVDSDLNSAISEWISVRSDKEKGTRAAESLDDAISQAMTAANTDEALLKLLLRQRNSLKPKSQWLVGGSNWAYDLSLSGIHHVIASKQNVNLLIIETEPISNATRGDTNSNWKKDIGLYAMNYGNSYVASIALFSQFSQTMSALMEAAAFDGPSIVLAYAPVFDDHSNAAQAAISMLQETKIAVDTGRWPLYRWNPTFDVSADKFKLDSRHAKRELKEFLKRDNHLSLLARQVPTISHSLASSLGLELKEKHEQKVKELSDSFSQLLKGLDGPSLLILFGSDGGNAQDMAERLGAEGTARGVNCNVMPMSESSLSEMGTEERVVFVVSTAGQGEMPGNAKSLWNQLKNDAGTGLFTGMKFSVFALGDSHYWPRPGEEIYFAKAGKDIDLRMVELGAERMIDLGIGDDQDEDGRETGYSKWEPLLWDYLGVGGGPSRSKREVLSDDKIKGGSNFLRGTILESLADESTGAIAKLDTKLTKFHGIYMQDDRDLRAAREEEGLEKAYSFMIRVRVPGGICTPAQYLAMDELGTRRGNGTLKLTTRQAFQLHGVIKRELKPTVAEINQTLMDTLAACGDVNRNVMSSCNPRNNLLFDDVMKFANELSAHLSPRTTAYHEIWLDKKRVAGHVDEEPLYGPTYLPRKFKVAIAIPPNNDVDVFAHCLGYIAVADEKTGRLAGFNVTIGGGMGMTHNNKKTYPCVAQDMGFVTLEEAIIVGEKVMLVQRDHGDRVNRKHARLKYTLEDHGMEWFREQVEERAGFKLAPSKPYELTSNGDILGWNKTLDGTWNYTLFIEHGRIKDVPGYNLKTGLKKIAETHTGDFRLTGNANLVIGNVSARDKPKMDRQLRRLGIENGRHTGLRLNSMACAALPYCGLAMAESERYLPSLITVLDEAIEEAGLAPDAITIRMTGCPNGCARPYVAEIAFVGKSPGLYNLYLGGGHAGQRLNKLYRSNVDEKAIVEILSPMFHKYAAEREDNEHFGDFVIRKGIIAATKRGPDFHENLPVQVE